MTINKNIVLSVLVLLVALAATPAFAQTPPTTSTKASGAARTQKMIQRSDAAITARINKLNALAGRVNAMQKLSATEKSTLEVSLQNEVTQLTTLKSTIDADTDATTLKTAMQSITKSYRIYALVLPQASVAAASDRILTIVGLMDGVQIKLQARISQLTSTDNTASLQSAMSDITAKLADATVQANAAVAETSSLMPDQGNASVMASNTAALKDARNKIQSGTADLKAARKDFTTIVQGIKALEHPTSATAQ